MDTYCPDDHHLRGEVVAVDGKIVDWLAGELASTGKSDTAMVNEVLAKLVCNNLCCVILSQCELGIEAEFWQDDAGKASQGADVLPLVRPG